MTRDERDVLKVIEWYQQTARRGPTYREIVHYRPRHTTDVRKGLDRLKRARVVSWRNDGSGTRYSA